MPSVVMMRGYTIIGLSVRYKVSPTCPPDGRFSIEGKRRRWMVMDWLGLAFQNPIENAPLWFIIAMAFVNVITRSMKFVSGIFKTNSEIVGKIQDTNAQENMLQSQILDEMTARRVSDDAHKRSLIALYKKTLSQIDDTTQDTNSKAVHLITETRRTQMALKRLYEELKKQGVIS